jgi:hypothetical protein
MVFLPKSKEGQLTMVGLILLVVSVITLAALMPVLNIFIGTAAGNATEAGHGDAGIIINLIPLFLWLGLIITIFVYTQVQR